MIKAGKFKYEKLHSKWFCVFINRKLWLGPDHLLVSEAVISHERYKRFSLNDIQVVFLKHSISYCIWNTVWGLLASLFGLIFLFSSGANSFAGALAGGFLIALLINIYHGPVCVLYLQTAVQVQKITAFTRRKKALRLMDHIKKLVEQEQGAVQKSVRPNLLNPDS
ncbi:MAG: hypothetical protein GY874_11285 [Desulfobacteraceae bacterium]|nr:hypothetical protein [Desulfobacteraceae bacterium]